VQAADLLLEHMSRTLWDPVDPTQLGSLDPKLHAKVNGEIYRFARTVTLARFRSDPTRWCGILRDPVSGIRFIPEASSPHLAYQDSPYFFACDSTRAAFRSNPGFWAIHRGD
jgi:YHS domain-containing protein